MTYKLGSRSKERLEGVDERLQAVVRSAIGQSSQDFSVICGLRTIEEQRKLVAKGASQTMKSKHIDGLAVDLAAYENGIRWELNLYDEIADAMREAAKDCGVKIRWGAAWHIDDFGSYDGTAEEAMNEYIDLRRSQGRRPFIDAPHFEIME
jgi:peptidoglycan L-alanyl-D-glutamate endopeptidase CwlK